MHTIYKLYYPDGTYYIGVTNNIKRRLREHNLNISTSGWSNVEILFNNLTEQYAYEIEKILVSDHIDRDPSLRNRTRGGRHPFNMRLGVTHTEDTKKKISLSKLGKKINLSPESRRIKSEKMKGNNNPAKQQYVKDKLSAKTKENSKRRNQPGTMLGKKLSKEAIEKISYKINTPEGVFASSTQASIALKISQQTVINRCKSENFPEWWIISTGSKYNNVL